MSKDTGRKRLYSFYTDPDRLERLNRLAGFLSVKDGKRVTVSTLINTSIEQYLARNEQTISAMEKLSEEVIFSSKESVK